jgi:hypothetical protein
MGSKKETSQATTSHSRKVKLILRQDGGYPKDTVAMAMIQV